MDNLERIVKEAAALGAAQLAVILGLTAGEISQRKARDTYGKWFDEAVNRGRIRPVRIDNGHRKTKHYRIVDIQQLKTADLVRAELQFRQNPLHHEISNR